MKVFPDYSGPMAGWPEAAAVEGARESLEALYPHYQMVVATNASDSDAEQVWQALRRVGLGDYFKAVFTSKELGSRKGETGFYRQIEKVMDRTPDRIIMIGDGYNGDVLGPKKALWRAVWYNPKIEASPGLLPLHDLETAHLTNLPEILSRPPLPDYLTALAWLLEHGTPVNILAHIHLVAAAAYQLAVWLREMGEPVNPVLAQRGAMLHDLAKMESILMKKDRGEHGDHARMARDLLLEHSQPELAEIADRHMSAVGIHSHRAPVTWEQKIVHYADKLAEGSEIVTLAERVNALIMRYPDYASELDESQEYLDNLQAKICASLDQAPGDLFNRLKLAVSGMT